MTERSLTELLAPVTTLLLDFDGPICSIFAGLPASVVAERLRNLVESLGGSVPLNADTEHDPIAVFRSSGALGPDVARRVEAALRAAELEAVPTARPTPGSADLLRACAGVGIRVAVVSNNSTESVRAYLRMHGLADRVAVIAGRDDADMAHLKPSPFLVHRALAELGVKPLQSVLVGDSPGDVEAARMATVRAVGFANKPGKYQRLVAAGADAVFEDFGQIAAVIRSRPSRGGPGRRGA